MRRHACQTRRRRDQEKIVTPVLELAGVHTECLSCSFEIHNSDPKRIFAALVGMSDLDEMLRDSSRTLDALPERKVERFVRARCVGQPALASYVEPLVAILWVI